MFFNNNIQYVQTSQQLIITLCIMTQEIRSAIQTHPPLAPHPPSRSPQFQSVFQPHPPVSSNKLPTATISPAHYSSALQMAEQLNPPSPIDNNTLSSSNVAMDQKTIRNISQRKMGNNMPVLSGNIHQIGSQLPTIQVIPSSLVSVDTNKIRYQVHNNTPTMQAKNPFTTQSNIQPNQNQIRTERIIHNRSLNESDFEDDNQAPRQHLPEYNQQQPILEMSHHPSQKIESVQSQSHNSDLDQQNISSTQQQTQPLSVPLNVNYNSVKELNELKASDVSGHSKFDLASIVPSNPPANILSSTKTITNYGSIPQSHPPNLRQTTINLQNGNQGQSNQAANNQVKMTQSSTGGNKAAQNSLSTNNQTQQSNLKIYGQPQQSAMPNQYAQLQQPQQQAQYSQNLYPALSEFSQAQGSFGGFPSVASTNPFPSNNGINKSKHINQPQAVAQFNQLQQTPQVYPQNGFQNVPVHQNFQNNYYNGQMYRIVPN